MSDAPVVEPPVEEPVEGASPEPEPEAPVEPELPPEPTAVHFLRSDESFRGEARWYQSDEFLLLVHVPEPGFETMSFQWLHTDPVVFDRSKYGTVHEDVRDVNEVLERLNYFVEWANRESGEE